MNIIGGACIANWCCGAGNAGGGGGAGNAYGRCGIYPCAVACASVITGDKVVLSRQSENLPGCSLI